MDVTIAQAIERLAKRAGEAMEMAGVRADEVNQDWERGVTQYVFDDKSVLEVSGIDFYVLKEV